jgi:hypothetical protein
MAVSTSSPQQSGSRKTPSGIFLERDGRQIPRQVRKSVRVFKVAWLRFRKQMNYLRRSVV